jgi:hypothetical protein
MIHVDGRLVACLVLSWIPLAVGACATSSSSQRTEMAKGPVPEGTWQQDFELCHVGRMPQAWHVAETNPTEALATWSVIDDQTSPAGPRVMALTETSNYDGTFNLAIFQNVRFKDLDLTVQVKAVKGEEDQGGGPIWRCRDENNYYICRFNPLEGNYRVYKVVEGKRRQLDSVRIETQAGRWYTVRVSMAGDRIACFLDGKKLLEVQDDTFMESGMVGLWTKADAVTSFDALTVRPHQVD